MKTLKVTIADELDEFVQDRVRSGDFRDQSEVIQKALEEMRELDQVKAKIAQGLAEAERGSFVEQSFDEIVAEAKAEYVRKP